METRQARHEETVCHLAEHHVRQFLQAHRFSAATDAELLERFLTQHEESAFGELVERHGPLVLGLCRRVLRNQHDAEDAFQATFLILARKGGSISRTSEPTRRTCPTRDDPR